MKVLSFSITFFSAVETQSTQLAPLGSATSLSLLDVQFNVSDSTVFLELYFWKIVRLQDLFALTVQIALRPLGGGVQTIQYASLYTTTLSTWDFSDSVLINATFANEEW
jgi:hypothetical protein